MIKKAVLLSILFGYNPPSLYAAQVLTGNSKNPQETFTFNVLANALYEPNGRFFVGAASAVPGNEFAIAAAHRNATSFTALAPEKVMLNFQDDQKNPLYGAAIGHMAMMSTRPIVTKVGDPSSVYLVDDLTNVTAVFSATNIQDANGSPAKSLLALTSNAAYLLMPLDAGATLGAFAALGNAAGGFDGNGSGIAVLFFRKYTLADKKAVTYKWDIVDAQTGTSQFDTQGNPVAGGNRAFPISTATPEIGINSPVSSIGNQIDMHFDRDLGRLYVALNVQAGIAANAGARGIIVASFFNGKLMLQPIAADTAFTGTPAIVGSIGSLAEISILKVRTMQTTTYLRYLIVVGGNGAASAVSQKVFALPLVDNLLDAAHGTLANVQSAPLTLFAPHSPHQFQARVFIKPAEQPSELYTMNSAAAQVGGSGILPGPITDISVNGDTVFVSVNQSGNGLAAGIFYSQALLSATGVIAGWTTWQRVGGVAKPVAGFSYDAFKGSFWYIPQSSSSIEQQQVTTTNTVLRTEFTDGSDPLGMFISKEFAQLAGGVQGLFDVPYTTPSLTTILGKRMSFNIYTGFEKVLLVQSGADSAGNFGPLLNISNPFSSQNGSLAGFNGSGVLSLRRCSFANRASRQCGSGNRWRMGMVCGWWVWRSSCTYG